MARKILLADDSVTAQNMGRRILSDAGYDVTTVNNGSAALKKIAESKPDLIVLDVYMPGYGGLEVCQRLREAPETARIPVLLTVGKLEPFKPEEARRVRADAFIVKPFEASELLTALTKLEDKIVPPQSQSSRQSRFAKALAGVEEPNPSREFGDSETGWKNRLSIPPPHSKHRETPAEEPSAVVASLREAVKADEAKPVEMKSGIEEALLSSMPQDVTDEEIAAIKAAAAAFSIPGNESNFRQARDEAEPQAQEPVLTESNVSDQAIAAETTVEPAAAAEVPSEVPVPAALSESTAAEAMNDAPTSNREAADDEVSAALAAIAPTNGHGESVAMGADTDKWSRDQVPVTMAVAGAAESYSGPRWIAESVAVMGDEATLVLEQEMEKAYAAFAAADAARMGFGNSFVESSSLPVADAPAINLESISSPAESFVSSENSAPEPHEITTPAASTSQEESAVAAEPGTAAASSSMDAVSESTVPELQEPAAYAAAASASGGTTDMRTDAETASQPSSMMESSESIPAAPESSGQQGESELAAAWANWKQVRESVIGSQLSSQIAETVAEFKESSGNAQPESQLVASSATEEDSSDISNIVDSVLADLKPKLMAEIAKKMGKEKKK